MRHSGTKAASVLSGTEAKSRRVREQLCPPCIAERKSRRSSKQVCATLLIGALLLAPSLLSGQAPSAQEAAPSTVAPAAQPQREHTLLFVGDVMLSRGVGAKMKAENDWAYPYRKILDTLRTADLTIGNLECPVSDGGKNQYHLYSFRADPRALTGLKEASFDIVSLANNHIYDWGAPALLDTLRRVREAGMQTLGAGGNDLEAHYPLVVDLDGVRLAFLAYVNVVPKEAAAGPDRPGVAWLDADRALGDIRFARQLADVVVVLPHWGVEYAKLPSHEQIELAHRMVEAGADLVIGTHPHVVQPLEPYRGRWIAYSLGNFVFDQKPGATREGLMLKVTLQGKQVAALLMMPITINQTFQPQLATAEKTGGNQTQRRRPHPAQ